MFTIQEEQKHSDQEHIFLSFQTVQQEAQNKPENDNSFAYTYLCQF